MNKLDLVIFDMDGLLLDTETISLDAWKITLNNYNLNIDIEKLFFDKMLGSNEKAIKNILMEVLNNDEELFINTIKTHRNECFNIVREKGINIKKGAEQLISFLNDSNIKKAVASSSIRKKVDLYLEKTNLKEQFDYIVCGDEVEAPKPYPHLYNNACGYFNADKNNVIILEDSKNGLLSAKNAEIEKRFYIPDLLFHLLQIAKANQVYKIFFLSAKNAEIEKRFYIPDLLLLSEEDEKELAYKKFNDLLEVKDYIETNFK